MEARDVQVDGGHYKHMGYQPFEFAMDVGGLPGICKVAKYLTRNKGDRLVNLKKAMHVIALEEEYMQTPRGIALYDQEYLLTVDDEECISRFCDQFEEGDFYIDILSNLIESNYKEAKACMQDLVLHEEGKL